MSAGLRLGVGDAEGSEVRRDLTSQRQQNPHISVAVLLWHQESKHKLTTCF